MVPYSQYSYVISDTSKKPQKDVGSSSGPDNKVDSPEMYSESFQARLEDVEHSCHCSSEFHVGYNIKKDQHSTCFMRLGSRFRTFGTLNNSWP